MHRISALLWFLAFALPSHVSAEKVAYTELQVQLFAVSDSHAVLGVTLSPDESWHTYWSNPGDAGMSLSVSVLGEGVTITPQDYPIPKRYELGGLIAYGYDAKTTFLYDVKGVLPQRLKGTLAWLACDDTTCVPGSAEFDLKVVLGTNVQPEWYEEAVVTQPQEVSEDVLRQCSSSVVGKVLTVSITETEYRGWSVFPYDGVFSEVSEETKVSYAEGEGHFSFHFLGDLPDEADFLITNGVKGYKVMVATK